MIVAAVVAVAAASRCCCGCYKGIRYNATAGKAEAAAAAAAAVACIVTRSKLHAAGSRAKEQLKFWLLIVLSRLPPCCCLLPNPKPSHSRLSMPEGFVVTTPIYGGLESRESRV